MLPLQGIGVLVTRPEQQAMRLCRLLESFGALAVRHPAIRIQAVGSAHELQQRLGKLDDFNLIIFTSTNAVRFGIALLDQRQRLTLAAIGRATARALNQAGYGVAVTPAEGFDSESLLSHPSLARVDGSRVLLVKGVGGREVLQDQLIRRGAQVIVAEVYERQRVSHSPATLEAVAARMAANEIHVITATSADIAASLLKIATPALRREFDHLHWLVPGPRVAGAVRALGVRAPILQADTAEDQDLASAILRWRGGASGKAPV